MWYLGDITRAAEAEARFRIQGAPSREPEEARFSRVLATTSSVP
jgi:hypothetical protein